MPRFAPEKVEAIQRQIREYWEGGANLSVRSCAEALGLSRETVSKYARRAGVPLAGESSFVDPPATPPDELAAGPLTDSDPATPPDTAASTSSEPIPPQPPAAPAASPPQLVAVVGSAPKPPQDPAPAPHVPAGPRYDDTVRLLQKVQAEFQQIPGMSAQAVEDAMRRVLGEDGAEAESAGRTAAMRRIVGDYTASVVDTAVTINAQNAETGEAIRRVWNEQGHRREFQSPLALWQVAYDFWWTHRDRIAAMKDQLEVLTDQLMRYEGYFSADRQQTENVDRAWQVILAAAMNGRPLTREETIGLLQAARSATALPARVIDLPPAVEVVPGG